MFENSLDDKQRSGPYYTALVHTTLVQAYRRARRNAEHEQHVRTIYVVYETRASDCVPCPSLSKVLSDRKTHHSLACKYRSMSWNALREATLPGLWYKG